MKAQTALADHLETRIAGEPGRPEVRLMPRTVAAVTQPVQRHAHALQIIDGRGLLRFTTQQTDAGETETPARRGQRMQMIGVRSPQADHPLRTSRSGLLKIGRELEPLVAGQQWVDKIQAQASELDAGGLEPVQLQRL